MWEQYSLAGQTAIVTGVSRRRGIGAAIARELAGHGATIFMTYWQGNDRQAEWSRDEDGPAAIQAEIQGLGVPCESFEADLSRPDSATLILDELARRGLTPTILVNNATYSTNDGFEQLDAATLDAHYAVNMRGTFLLSVEFCKRFQGTAGRIINLTSGQSLGPMPEELAYTATKGAVEVFTRSLAAGVARRGITVNAVNPGPTDSGWITPDLSARLLQHFPAGRLGQPADAARLVAFLATPAAEWITGQVIHSEGGFERF